MTWSGPALRSAWARPRRPSPASATTMTAPTRQHGVDRDGQVDPGRDQQRHPVARPHAVGAQPGGQVGDPPLQLGERGGAGRAAASSTTAGGVVLAALQQAGPGQLVRARRQRRPPWRPRPAVLGSAGDPGCRPSARRPRPRRGASSVTRCERPGIALHVGLRQPVHAGRAARPSVKTGSRGPQSSSTGTSVSVAQPGGDARRAAARLGWSGLERDVGDEVADGAPAVGACGRAARARAGPRRAARAGTAHWRRAGRPGS